MNAPMAPWGLSAPAPSFVCISTTTSRRAAHVRTASRGCTVSRTGLRAHSIVGGLGDKKDSSRWLYCQPNRACTCCSSAANAAAYSLPALVSAASTAGRPIPKGAKWSAMYSVSYA